VGRLGERGRQGGRRQVAEIALTEQCATGCLGGVALRLAVDEGGELARQGALGLSAAAASRASISSRGRKLNVRSIVATSRSSVLMRNCENA
jgi:hypothetical protein